MVCDGLVAEQGFPKESGERNQTNYRCDAYGQHGADQRGEQGTSAVRGGERDFASPIYDCGDGQSQTGINEPTAEQERSRQTDAKRDTERRRMKNVGIEHAGQYDDE